ncbi:hypothetical protein EAEG_01886 [Escherichia coli B921]|nr:hypothetical protein ECSTECEH250_3054 [Escherichia coli STEC_EH250]EHV70523.1 hypothetical protein ECDEC6D_3029 [Escherichia coli DEC6D]OSK67380.1 hypothetical protein EAEG_01886 [Escherichia coli B921]
MTKRELLASIVSAETRLHYYGNTTCWKGREPDQQQKPPDFGGFLFFKGK